jgi:NitT/TauT family transport system permease protein
MEKTAATGSFRSLWHISREVRLIIGAAVIAALIWEIAGRLFRLTPDVIPTPARILLEIWREAPVLREHSLVTFSAVLIGLVVAFIAAIPLSYAGVRYKGMSRFITQLAGTLGRASLIVWPPIMVGCFGIGILPRVLICAVLGLVPLAANITKGFQSLPWEVNDLLKLARAGYVASFMKVRLPACLPFLIGGLKSALVMAVVGAVFGEVLAGDRGLGFLIESALLKMDAPMLFASVAVLSALVLALYSCVMMIERFVIPWHVEASRHTAAFSD